MKYNGDGTMKFANGSLLYAKHGIIGINEALDVFEGYESPLRVTNADLTRQERAELADYMRDLWQQFKAQDVDPPVYA